MQIWNHGTAVGSWIIRQEGLYLRVIGTVPRTGEGFFRLILLSQKKRIPLGVMMPRGKELYLEKRLPKKDVPEGAVAVLEEPGVTVYPVASDSPFVVPEKLEQGKLEKWGKIYGISISSSTGQ